MRDSHLTVIDAEKLKRSSFKLPQPLLALQKNAKTCLVAQLATVFDHVDDTFFDLADRAENSRHQTVYFDAMRLIRVERKAIEHHFFNALASNFQQLGDEKYRGNVASLRGGQSLELVENEDLEEIIALDTMVSKTSELCKAELEPLSARVNSLVPAMVSAKNNPVGPDTICEAFNSAVAHLELSLPAKLVFLKLFERHVMMSIKAFLVESNRHLKGLGVLPDFELKRKAKEEKPSSNQTVKESGATHRSSGANNTSKREGSHPEANSSGSRQTGRPRFGQFISQLQNMMQWETSKVTSGLAEGSEPAVLDLPQLTSMVADIQSEWCRQVIDPQQSDKSLLALIEESLSSQGNGVLGATERGMVDLLDKLFVKVNTEAIAAAEISQELRKLELPILQVALQDATFFDREKHPARRLLNEVAEASIGYTDGVDVNQDPVAKAIAQLSETLYSEHQPDNAALTQLLLNFIELVETERRRVAALERRIMEEVAATEKVNQAHQAVVKVLIDRIQGKTLPRFLVSFTEDAWCKALFLAYLRSGADSEAWHTRIQLLDQLLTLVRKGPANEVVGEEAIDPLIDQIREHLGDISYDPYDSGRLVGAMEQYFKGEDFSGEKYLSEERGGSSLGETSENLLKDVLVESLRTDIPGESPSPDENHGENGDVAENVDDQLLRRADSLIPGSWVEFSGEELSKSRGKVAGIISPSGKFVFVNRQGFKVFERDRYSVALDLQNKKIKPLEKSRLFDRALEGVVKEMRHHRSEHA
jgi:Protein of unknown function (DUF1631)